jgi:NADH:ubiquinone oxidoreductase subunit 5 (subunit L)/multisubunit Na+/H+ antiporter MnhA subunit
VQNDIKRLLAFSSIENLAIVIAAIGLGIIFAAYGKTTMAAIALLACLYHCFNHLCYKSLLFLGAGQILHSTGQRDMNKLGGLIHQMPWLAIAMLVGILAASGLPPLNGFVSEWLLLQAFLFFPNLPTPYLTMLVPIGAALLILAAALSGYAMVKCYGISFLGRPRHTLAQQPHDLDKLGRLALGLLALLCIVFGVLPFLMVKILMNPISDLLKQPFSSEHFLSGWLFLAPVAADRASYSPLLFFCAIGIAIALVSVIIYYLFHGKLRRAAAWDCGFAEQTPRMQDTADGFAQPVEHIFNAFFDSERTLPAATDNTPRYQLLIQDRFWKWLYLPVAHSTKRLSDLVGKIQQGKIGIYLLYGFLTLIILLLMI